MSDIGTVLRTAREEKQITLETVEKDTSIRKAYLEAVETNAFSVIPGEVFVKGIIRTYGNYLGLDGLQLVEEYKAAAGIQTGSHMNDNNMIRESGHVKINPSFRSNRDIGSGAGSDKKKWLVILAVLVLIGAIGTGVYYYFFAAPGTGDRSPKTGKTSVSVASDTGSNLTKGAKQPSAAAGETVLKITSRGRCWLRVTTQENRILFEGILRKGETKQFREKSLLRVNIGNLRDLSIEHNGVLLPPETTDEPVIRTYAPAGKDNK